MDRLIRRWKNTGAWTRMMQIKMVVVEPKQSSKFDEVMQMYR